MAYPKNHILGPLVNPELSDLENLASITPDQVRWLTVAGSLAIGQFTDEQIHPEVLTALETGDEMYYLIRHPKNEDAERLVVTVSRNTADTITDSDCAVAGLQRLGVLRAGSVWEGYRKRDVVTIYSEPHGAILFGFDTETGKRFMPDSVEGISPDRGWSIVSITEAVSLEQSFARPALGENDQ